MSLNVLMWVLICEYVSTKTHECKCTEVFTFIRIFYIIALMHSLWSRTLIRKYEIPNLILSVLLHGTSMATSGTLYRVHLEKIFLTIHNFFSFFYRFIWASKLSDFWVHRTPLLIIIINNLKKNFFSFHRFV